MTIASYRAKSRSVSLRALSLSLLVTLSLAGLPISSVEAGPPSHARGGGGGGGNDGGGGNNGNGRGNQKQNEEEVVDAEPDATEDETVVDSEPDGDSDSDPGTVTSVSLSWQLSLERENGDQMHLYEVEGTEIVYRLDGETDYNWAYFVKEDGESATITGLDSGVYYFAARTQDIDGQWSAYSNEITIHVD